MSEATKEQKTKRAKLKADLFAAMGYGSDEAIAKAAAAMRAGSTVHAVGCPCGFCKAGFTKA